MASRAPASSGREWLLVALPPAYRKGAAVLALAASALLGQAGLRWWRRAVRARPLPKQTKLARKLRVAIIGAGVGGTSLACWLRDLYGEDLDLTVISDSPVGGRVQTVKAADGRVYEGGASIVSDMNEYMMGFMQRFGLEEKYFGSLDVPLGIFDGRKLLMREADPTQAPCGIKRIVSLRTMGRMLSRYGLWQLRRLQRLTSHRQAPSFPKLYRALRQGRAFQTADDLLEELGPCCPQMMKETATHWLTMPGREGGNLSEAVVRELATGGMRANYGGQTCDTLHAMVGLVSIAGGFASRCFAIKGGNQQVPERSLEAACPESRLLGYTVRSLQKAKQGGWALQIEQTGKAEAMKSAGSPPQQGALETKGPFDIVAVAHPLARSSMRMDIEPKVSADGTFQRCVTHFVHGVLQPKYFPAEGPAIGDKAPPMAVLTVGGATAPFYSIGLQLPVDTGSAKEAQGWLDDALLGKPRIFKVFAPERLSDAQLDEIFEKREGEIKVLDWYAYPEYQVPQGLKPFVLDGSTGSLLYLNAIEEVASAMEMSVLSARNAANLVVDFVEQRRQETRTQGACF